MDLKEKSRTMMAVFSNRDSVKELLELWTSILSQQYERIETSDNKKYPPSENFMDLFKQDMGIEVEMRSPEQIKDENDYLRHQIDLLRGQEESLKDDLKRLKAK
jgi:hypothetical protein